MSNEKAQFFLHKQHLQQEEDKRELFEKLDTLEEEI
jgi:hypothetical protein